LAVLGRGQAQIAIFDEPNRAGDQTATSSQLERGAEAHRAMKAAQTKALAQLELALAKVHASRARLRGVGRALFMLGEGKKRSQARYEVATGGVYQAVGTSQTAEGVAVVPLWDFDAKQRRALVALEQALGACAVAGLTLLSTPSGLLAVETDKLVGEAMDLEDLQEETVAVEDAGAWR
jgi:hypothetical protein